MRMIPSLCSGIHNNHWPANWLLASILFLIRARNPFAMLRIRAYALLNCGYDSNFFFDWGNWYKMSLALRSLKAQSPKPRVMKRLIHPLEKIHCGYMVHHSSKLLTIVLRGGYKEVQSISRASSEVHQEQWIARFNLQVYRAIAICRVVEGSGFMRLD